MPWALVRFIREKMSRGGLSDFGLKQQAYLVELCTIRYTAWTYFVETKALID